MAERFASALLVHGAGGGAWEWRVWTDVFAAAGIQTVALELMPVAAGCAATGLDDYVAQVGSRLQELPRPCVLVGASLGGLLAMLTAEAAGALVLVNPIPPAPLHDRLPSRDWPGVVPWQRQARLQSTLDALQDADPAAGLFAFRRWRDESGAVLRQACAGVTVARPSVPVLCMGSSDDLDVPLAITEALADRWACDLVRLDNVSHAGPLLGRSAADAARQALSWLMCR